MEHGAEPPDLPPHFDHRYVRVKVGVVKSCDHRRQRRFEVGAECPALSFFRVSAVLRTSITNFAPAVGPLRVTVSMVYHVESYLSLVVILQNLAPLIYHAILMFFRSQTFGGASYNCGTICSTVTTCPH